MSDMSPGSFQGSKDRCAGSNEGSDSHEFYGASTERVSRAGSRSGDPSHTLLPFLDLAT